MRIKSVIYSLVIVIVFVIYATSCKKGNDTNNPVPDVTVKDIDGNVYHTVIIGTQTWMVENLKVTKLNDGTTIPNVPDKTAWDKSVNIGYCWYNNDISNKILYGGLYNWYSLNTGKLCPSGWHVPSVTEFTTLINYLGGSSVAGGKLKEKGYAHWAKANDVNGPDPAIGISNATNESGFTSLPGGYRYVGIDEFADLGFYTDYWTSNEADEYSTIPILELGYNGDDVSFYSHAWKAEGHSVRCIKD